MLKSIVFEKARQGDILTYCLLFKINVILKTNFKTCKKKPEKILA